MTLKGQREIKQGLLRLIQPKETEFDAYVGDGAGNIEVAGHEGDWYVRPIGSDLPIVVKKGAAPRVEGVRVRIGREYDDGRSRRRGRLKIKGTVETGDVTISGVEAHGDSHLAGGSDPIYIDTIQIINGLVYATSGMSVAINAGWAVIDGQPVKWSLSALNLTSDIPLSGALYGLVRVDADGVIDSQPGDAVASFADLTWADVPKIENGYAGLAIVRLYSGQTELSRLYASPDVIDLRFAPSNEAGQTAIALGQLEDEWDIEFTRHQLGY